MFHYGLARPGHAPGTAKAGEVATKAMAEAKGNYLANLILYPGERQCRHLRAFAWQDECACDCVYQLPCTHILMLRVLHTTASLQAAWSL